jgi:hypothetical protein
MSSLICKNLKNVTPNLNMQNNPHWKFNIYLQLTNKCKYQLFKVEKWREMCNTCHFSPYANISFLSVKY